MAIDRRQLLKSAGALTLLGTTGTRALADIAAKTVRPRYLASCKQGADAFSLVTFDAEVGVINSVALPARGHDIALRPGTTEGVVFARRPGTFAVAFDTAGDKPSVTFTTRPDRHFFGHGVFSSDGRLLYATENDFDGERGTISVRDATNGYAQIGEFASGGIGPHDIAFLSDGLTLVVANGGIDTNPEAGRVPLNLDTMQPSLAYIDVRTGEIKEQLTLDPALHQLSIRHLAVAAGDVVTFGCQNEGQGLPALVGWHKRGASKPSLFEAPDLTYSGLKNYVGSVSVDASGEIVAATSPRGGRVLFFDTASKRFLGDAVLADVCGVAPGHAGAGFLLTSGQGDLVLTSPGAALSPQRFQGYAFDNHAVALGDKLA
jgi:uncharacterized protein